MCRYIFSFAVGAGPVTGIIIPELSSTKMRGKIMGFSFSVHWVGIRAITNTIYLFTFKGGWGLGGIIMRSQFF